MGIKLFSPTFQYNPDNKYVSPDPDPSRFTIKRMEKVGNYTVCLVNYPGCTTYDGDKISVYSATSEQVKAQKLLDPHFLENNLNGLSPVACFPANSEGWKNAVLFAKILVFYNRG